MIEELFKGELAEEIKENVKKITLVISTQLAEDVYNIFKDFGFKNTLIQHTTLADVNFIAEFNKIFYLDLIRHLSKPINTIFESALINSNEQIDFKTFCCCFHSHKVNCRCKILENLKNEIYNYEYIKDSNLDYMKKNTPHFYHLFPLCKTYIRNFNINEKILNYSFSLHSETCTKNKMNYLDCFILKKKSTISFDDNYIKCFESKNKKGQLIKYKAYNFCCCDEKSENHNINMIFQKDFTKEIKNHLIHFRKAGTLREKLNFPSYEKFKLLVGKNNYIFQALKFFFSGYNYCNIYGDNIDNLKKFGSILKEYYLERYYFYELNNKDENEKNENELKKTISAPILNKNYNNEQDNKIDDELNLNRQLSLPFSSYTSEQIKEIHEIYYENFIKDQQKFNFNLNIIYFIYISSEETIDENKEILLNNKKIIFFSEEKLAIVDNILNIELTKEPIFQTEKYYKNPIENKVSLNEYIKFQHLKDVQNWRKIFNWDG